MISIGYLAGFIDGEGSFTAHSTQKASPSIVIVNTDSDILEEISDTIESLIGRRPNIKTKWQSKGGGSVPLGNYKTCYILRLGTPIRAGEPARQLASSPAIERRCPATVSRAGLLSTSMI